MKKNQFYMLLDLLEDIKGVDKMITLHHGDDTGFMLHQYQAKKQKLVSNLIDQLVSPPLISARSIHTVKMIIDRFYGDEMKNMDVAQSNDELSQFEQALAS